jgi:glycosyltransferase involved in cell wall biosynthesis
MEAHTDPEVQEWVRKTKKLISETEGFKNLGRISHSEVSKLTKISSIYAYGTYFPEIDCISMTKAMAGGAIPVITPTGALCEKTKFYSNDESLTPVKPRLTYDNIDYSVTGPEFDEWVQRLINQLNTVVTDQRNEMSTLVCETYDWESIVEQWIG